MKGEIATVSITTNHIKSANITNPTMSKHGEYIKALDLGDLFYRFY